MLRNYSHPRHRLWVVVCATVLAYLCAATALGGAGAQATSGPCPPSAIVPAAPAPLAGSAQPSPEAILACVASQPITGAQYTHWALVSQAAVGSSPGEKLSPQAVTDQVMGFLISSDWVFGEAAALHIAVSSTRVRHTFDRIRKLQFPKHREFTKFLEHSKESTEDLLLRVKLNLLSERIMKTIGVGLHTVKARQRALNRFIRAFDLKWPAQTYCDPGYVVRDCGHVQSGL